MLAYIIRRLLLIIPTLLAIITINFFLVQMAPGGPVDQMIAQQMGLNASMLDRVTGNNAPSTAQNDLKNADRDSSLNSRAAIGLTPADIEAIKKQFGFDRPMHERYFTMLWDYLRFDFGDSLFRGRSVSELIIERLPVSISLGLWTTLLVYLISIPLGIRKAISHSSRFDIWTTSIVLAANAIPSFLFAVLLIIVFAGGNYFDIFPLRGLVSNDFEQLGTMAKIADYFHHMFLPVVAMTIGGFASFTLLVYLISIPLGIRKAISHSSRFDIWTTSIVLAANAIPSFLFAVLLIIVFAGGNYFDIFPLRGLVSNDFEQLGTMAKIADYFHHMFLPVVAMTIGGFASLTMLTKNSFLDEIHKQYVITAKAKGLTQRSILYRHVFRNAMLIIIAGFPAAFIGIFFTGSLLIEVIFSLDGLGLLGYEATLGRDYPVIFATLYIFGLVGLLMSILSDVMYSVVDPRINFDSQS